MEEIIDELRNVCDCIVIDSAPGLGPETRASISAADEIILITNAEMPSVTDALKTAKLAQNLHKKVRGFIVTRYKGEKTEMSLENIEEMLDVPLLGVVLEDKNMQKALVQKTPIFHSYPRSKASKSYLSLAYKLAGKEEKQGFFSKLFG
jgi:septum site-determining protein MinD